MIKIKVVDAAPDGACSYYRGLGVTTQLRHIDPNIDVEFIREVTWMELLNTDILYIIRPIDAVHIKIIELAKMQNVKVWIDFDDLLHELPEDNPGYEVFSSKEKLNNIVKSINMADIVTVSTEEIRKYYEKLNPNIFVIPNAHNDYLYLFELKENDTNIVYWRGSETHREDLLSCKNQFGELSKIPDWKWYFIGQNPWFISRSMVKGSFIRKIGEPVPFYFEFMRRLKPAVSVFPLVFSRFNAAKSNCNWIESTYFGAACVAPLLGEFCVPGVQTYKDPENFKYYTEKLIKSKSFRQERYKESFEYIKENLMLSKVNQKRVELVYKVVK